MKCLERVPWSVSIATFNETKDRPSATHFMVLSLPSHGLTVAAGSLHDFPGSDIDRLPERGSAVQFVDQRGRQSTFRFNLRSRRPIPICSLEAAAPKWFYERKFTSRS